MDLFATIGAIRRESDEEITARFIRAFAENKDVAMKLLFFARDIRGGLGERKVFRVILNWLAKNYPETVRKNLNYIAEYGRYDDLLVLFDTPVEKDMLEMIRQQLRKDLYAVNNHEEVSLLGKWLPSVNASNLSTIKAQCLNQRLYIFRCSPPAGTDADGCVRIAHALPRSKEEGVAEARHNLIGKNGELLVGETFHKEGNAHFLKCLLDA